MKTTLTLFLISLSINAFACSCGIIISPFCNTLHSPEDSVLAFKGKVIKSHIDNSMYQAVALEVLEVYRDDFGITPVVELYGTDHLTACHIQVVKTFPIGKEFYISTIGNLKPDTTIWDGDNFKVFLITCITNILSEEDGLVSGRIYSENGTSTISEFPASIFQKALNDCNFEIEEEEEDVEEEEIPCLTDKMKIFPNPSISGNFNIDFESNDFRYDQVVVYSLAGKKILDKKFNAEDDATKLVFPQNPPGIYFVEIICSENRYVRKVVIL